MEIECAAIAAGESPPYAMGRLGGRTRCSEVGVRRAHRVDASVFEWMTNACICIRVDGVEGGQDACADWVARPGGGAVDVNGLVHACMRLFGGGAGCARAVRCARCPGPVAASAEEQADGRGPRESMRERDDDDDDDDSSRWQRMERGTGAAATMARDAPRSEKTREEHKHIS